MSLIFSSVWELFVLRQRIPNLPKKGGKKSQNSNWKKYFERDVQDIFFTSKSSSPPLFFKEIKEDFPRQKILEYFGKNLFFLKKNFNQRLFLIFIPNMIWKVFLLIFLIQFNSFSQKKTQILSLEVNYITDWFIIPKD